MKLKSFIILVVICCVLAGAAYLMLQKESPRQKGVKMGELLLKDFPVNDVADIAITTPDETIHLQRGEKIWEVKNRYGYPANFTKIADFVNKFKETKIGRTFPASEDTLSRLALKLPDDKKIPADQKGTRVIFKNKDGKAIQDILLGKARETDSGGGGHYIKKLSDSTVYVVDQDFKYLDKKVSDWLEKTILDINADDIEQVVCVDPSVEKPIYTLKRPEKNKPPEFIEPADAAAGKKIKNTAINSLFGFLSNLRLDDVIDPSATEPPAQKGKNFIYKFRQFNGTVYSILAKQVEEKGSPNYYMKIKIGYEKPPEKKDLPENGKDSPEMDDQKPTSDEGSKEGDKTEVKESPEALMAKAEALNQDINPWTYVIPKWKFDKLISNTDAFFEQEKTEEKKDESS